MTTATFGPTASNHDAFQQAGSVTLAGPVQVIGSTGWAGLLCPSVTIPAGATINSAVLSYKSTNTTYDSPDINWYCEAADNAAVFTTAASSISSRSRTTAYTNDTATNIGTTNWRTVDVTAAVAEVIARGGWASGNNLALIGDGLSASCDLYLRSYDSGGDVWKLDVDYTATGIAAIVYYHDNADY